MKTIIVFGAGKTGCAMAYMSVVFGKMKVNLIEPNWDRLHDALKMLASSDVLGKDINMVTDLLIPDYQVWESNIAMSCAPHEMNLELTRQAIERGMPYCDLGGCNDVVEAQAVLAHGAKTAVVPLCGFAPGMANILAADLAKRYGAKEIRVFCGGNPKNRPDKSTNPLQYKLVYSAEGLAVGYSRLAPEIHKGKFVETPALSRLIRVNDEFEAAPTSHLSRFSVKHLLSLGVQEFSYETMRYTGHYAAIKKLGWEPTHDPRSLAEKLTSMPALHFERGVDADRGDLIVEADKGPRYEFHMTYDPVTGFTAMEIMTAIGAELVAEFLANMPVKPKGFMVPEEFIDTEWAAKEFGRRLEHFNVL